MARFDEFSKSTYSLPSSSSSLHGACVGLLRSNQKQTKFQRIEGPLNRQTLTLRSSSCIRLESETFFTFVASFGSRYVCLAFEVLDSDLELFELVLHLCDLGATRQQFALFCSGRLCLGEACERKQSAKVLMV